MLNFQSQNLVLDEVGSATVTVSVPLAEGR